MKRRRNRSRGKRRAGRGEPRPNPNAPFAHRANVRIKTNNQEAPATTVYEFPRFQINDHRTGDSLEVSKQ